MNTSPIIKNKWYAIRTSFNRELRLQQTLKDRGLKTFIPMSYEKTFKDDVQQYIEVPAVHDLIFVYSSRNIIDKMKEHTNVAFHYINECGTQSPAVISETEMEEFVRITEMTKENILYLKDDFDRFKANSRIRITGGCYKGLEGYLVRIRRDRKVVFLLKDITAIAITGIDRSLIELVD